MSLKNDMSSEDEVSTERDGASQLWEVKGMEVSMVRVSLEEEMERRRWEDKRNEAGLRKLDPN